ESAIVLPPGVELAQSQSKEASQVAPQVIISRESVTFKMIEKTRSIEELSKDEISTLEPLIGDFKKYLLANQNVEGSDLVNIIGDSSTNYRVIYNVVKLLRTSGFQSMLFVAEGENQ
ncbi:MAG: hypothetical protein ACK5W9_14390, partial [Bdellovibrionales bacterium]